MAFCQVDSWAFAFIRGTAGADPGGLDNKGINGLKSFSRFVLLGYDYLITTADAKAGVSLY